jgi:hypothetical protein
MSFLIRHNNRELSKGGGKKAESVAQQVAYTGACSATQIHSTGTGAI